jgi:hypothetical protein
MHALGARNGVVEKTVDTFLRAHSVASGISAGRVRARRQVTRERFSPTSMRIE